MPDYRRSKVEGGFYFFTVVTYRPIPILTDEKAREILHSSWQNTKQRLPFETIAVCLLPDHIHSIWKLPEGDADYSMRWREIKRLFTKGYLKKIGPGENRNASRIKRGEAAIWQRRFVNTLLKLKRILKHIWITRIKTRSNTNMFRM